jgi:hypothetical protein
MCLIEFISDSHAWAIESRIAFGFLKQISDQLYDHMRSVKNLNH